MEEGQIRDIANKHLKDLNNGDVSATIKKLLQIKQKRAKFLDSLSPTVIVKLGEDGINACSFLQGTDKSYLRGQLKVYEARAEKRSAEATAARIASSGKAAVGAPSNTNAPANNSFVSYKDKHRPHEDRPTPQPVSLDKVALCMDPARSMRVLKGCNLHMARVVRGDYEYGGLQPLFDMDEQHTADILVSHAIGNKFDIEISLKQDYSSSLKYSSTGVSASVSAQSLYFSVDAAFQHKCHDVHTESSATIRYKYCAHYRAPCVIYSLDRAIQQNSLTLTSLAYTRYMDLINKSEVSSADAKAFVDMFGEVVPKVAVIGVSAIAESEKTMEKKTDATKSGSSWSFDVGASVGSFGVKFGGGAGASSASGKATTKETDNTTETLTWTTLGGSAIQGNNPENVAHENYVNNWANWRIIEYQEFCSTMDVIADLIGQPDELKKKARLSLGHLLPFQHYFQHQGGRYIGKFVRNSDPPIPHGKGTMFYDSGAVVEGIWSNGVLQGQGSVTYGNKKYLLQWKDGGVDKAKHNDLIPELAFVVPFHTPTVVPGDIYVGTLIRDYKKQGKGKYVWANGDKYEGDWVEDNRTGKGTKIWANGDKYEGGWVDNSMTGKGTKILASGAQYEGGWLKDMRNGKAIYTWTNGDKYEGDWVKDWRTGKGIYTWTNGDKYEGDWVDGNMTGKGMKIWASGTKYEGDWVDGTMTGKGKYKWPNGNKYEGDLVDGSMGDWVKGKRHGKGTMTCACGIRRVGNWKEGNEVRECFFW